MNQTSDVAGKKFVRMDLLIDRMDALSKKLPPKSEASGQIAYLFYVLEDIKKEGPQRSSESAGMICDIDSFCRELEVTLK